MVEQASVFKRGVERTPALYWALCVCVCATLLVGSRPAQAEDFDSVFQRGLSLYQKKDYAAAIDAFQAAYKVRQFPRVLLNIAQVYRKMGEAAKALDYYEQYLRAEPKMPAKIRHDVEQYVSQTKALLAATSLQDEADRRSEPAPLGFDKQTGNALPGYVQGFESRQKRKKALTIGLIAGGAAAAVILGVGLGVGLHIRNKLPDGLVVFEY
jgi:tetratricopeptide (TPR) repeat protein